MHKRKRKIHIREKLARVLDLPLEAFGRVVKVTMLGARHVLIENYEGIYLYCDSEVCVVVGDRRLSVCGAELEICEATSEQIMITGEIGNIAYSE